MVRLRDVQGEPLFEPSFGSYLEDAELGWRLRMRGKEVLYASGSEVEHKYHFARNSGFFELLERNRWFLLLAYYRRRTLLLLLPAILAMEVGLLVFFTLQGTPGVKLRAIRATLSRAWRAEVAAARQHIQSSRQLTDRQFMANFGGRVDFPHIRNPLLTYIGNPLLQSYWSLARYLIRW
jgi:GT2 family glycosyltransferase